MSHSQNTKQGRLAAAIQALSHEPRTEDDPATLEGLRTEANRMLDVLWALRDISEDLAKQATPVGTGANANRDVAYALRHYDQLKRDVLAAWRSTIKICEALQDPELVQQKFTDAKAAVASDDWRGWERAD